MAILETQSPVTMTQREVAVVVAQAVARHAQPVPSGRLRNDVDYIQIDPIIIEVRVTKPKPGVRLKFELKGGYGVTLNVNLGEFEASPTAYLRDLFTQLSPMLRDAQRRRAQKRAENHALYDMLTKGVSANG